MQGDDGLRDTSHARDDDYLDAGTGIDLVRGGGGTDTMLNAEAGGETGVHTDRNLRKESSTAVVVHSRAPLRCVGSLVW